MDAFRRLLALAVLVAVVAALAAGGPGRAATVPRPQRVAVLVLENRSYEQVIGNPAAPFLNRLARRYALATNYFAIGHRSLPNYIALTGGATSGINDNCTRCDTEQSNLLNQLDSANVSWRAYFEGLEQGRARQRVVDFGPLRRDIARRQLPRFSWIAPDVFHDGHDGTLRAADRYAARLVRRLVRALGPRGVLYVVWDEGPNSDLRGVDGSPGGGRVALIAAGGGARRHTRFGPQANHCALLRTIEAQFAVPPLRTAAQPSTPLLAGMLRAR